MVCDARSVVLGNVLTQKWKKIFHPICYAGKTLNEVQKNYIVIEQELFVVIYTFGKFQAYLFRTSVVVHTDHVVQIYLIAKKNAKP